MVQRSERFLKRKLETVSKVSRWYFELLELERTVSRLMNPHPTTTSTCYTLSLGPFQKPKTQTSLQPFQKPRTQTVWWPLWNFGSK